VLGYRVGQEITDRQSFVDIDQSFWTIRNGRNDFRYTIKDTRALERMLARAPRGFVAFYVDEEPATFLKVMIRRTGGRNENIPRTSRALTGEEWEPFYEEGDTATLVTCTSHPKYYGYKLKEFGGKKLAYEVVSIANKEYSDIPYLNTLSPINAEASLMHVRCGALPIVLLEKARPDFSLEDAISWGYRWPLNGYDLSLFGELQTRLGIDLRKESPHYIEIAPGEFIFSRAERH